MTPQMQGHLSYKMFLQQRPAEVNV